jgi:hypothetical protein
MGGLPDQTPDELAEEMDFINSLGIMVKPVFISGSRNGDIFAIRNQISSDTDRSTVA